MDPQQQIEFVKNTAVLMARLEQRGEKMHELLEASTQSMRSAVERAEKAATELMDSNRVEIATHAQMALKQGTEPYLRTVQERLESQTKTLLAAAQTLQNERYASAQHLQWLTWKFVALLSITSLGLLGGSGYLLWHNLERVHNSNIQAELLEAVAKGKLSNCGGKPCVKIDKNAPVWGKNGDYVLLSDK